MQQEVSLEQAVDTLRSEYGSTYVAGFEDGKADMAKTLQDKMALTHAQAGQAVEALVEGQTIRWLSKPDALPNQEGTMGMIVEEAVWQL